VDNIGPYLKKNNFHARIATSKGYVHQPRKEAIVIKPIVLSKFGDTLENNSDIAESYDLPAPLTQAPIRGSFKGYVGIHSCVKGNNCVVLMSLSPTHNVLVCNACHWRVPIPKAVKTYADLRRFFKEEI